MADTRQCPNCGAVNDVGFSMCQQCLTPLTAYAGQITGEAYEGKLADQVKALRVRPVIVPVMVGFLLVFALFGPLAIFIGSLPRHASSDPDAVYQASLSTAFSSISAFVTGLVMIPLAGLLGWVSYNVYTQRTWAWNASVAAVIVFLLREGLAMRTPGSHVLSVILMLAGSVLLAVWYRPSTRAWYGL